MQQSKCIILRVPLLILISISDIIDIICDNKILENCFDEIIFSIKTCNISIDGIFVVNILYNIFCCIKYCV